MCLENARHVRNAVQDLLWADLPEIFVTKRQRRDLARSLNDVDRVLRSWDHTEALLHAVFAFDQMLSYLFGSGETEIEWVQRHHFLHPEDADMEALFDKLGGFDLSNHRFQLFLEGLVSADVQVDADAQERVVEACNSVLGTGGA